MSTELLAGSAARFEALNGAADIFKVERQVRLAFLQLDRALNGDRDDPEEMELAVCALSNAVDMARRLNESHGTGA